MARAKNNGNGRLDDALANLVQTQAILNQSVAVLNQSNAAFQARVSEIDTRVAEMDRVNSERFARIEALLLEHNRILEKLPEAIRENSSTRIGSTVRLPGFCTSHCVRPTVNSCVLRAASRKSH